ncbi:MAG: transposase [Selenomonadaceae bacterium]|nr:transposase [Selenomonadaceae bacterium]
MATYIKSVRQYSRKLPPDTIDFLRWLTVVYAKVKKTVYERYGGIGSLGKLKPGYTVLNEMRASGMRQELGMPVVYYELAVLDALTVIKGRWGILRDTLKRLAAFHEGFTKEDKTYIYTILKWSSVYAAILKREDYEEPDMVKDLPVDKHRLNNWLRRQTRKRLGKIQVMREAGFKISPKAGYSYKNGVMRIAGRQPRKRVEIPMRDGRQFSRQLHVEVKEDYIVLTAPVTKESSLPEGWANEIYVHIGDVDALTLSNGHVYGEGLNKLTDAETERLNAKNRLRSQYRAAGREALEKGNPDKAAVISCHNLGTMKYQRQKERNRAKTTSFVNAALNRMLAEEKPCRIVITHPVKMGKGGKIAKSAKRKLTRSFRGFIRERLREKCEERSIELVRIPSKGTGLTCSVCGEMGKTAVGNRFKCPHCGYDAAASLNGARNIEKKYRLEHGSIVGS